MRRTGALQAIAVVIGTALVDYGITKWLDQALNDRGIAHDIALFAVTLFVIGAGVWLLARLWTAPRPGQPAFRSTMTAEQLQEFHRLGLVGGGGGGGGGGGVASGTSAAAGGGGGGGGPGQPGGRGGDAVVQAMPTEIERRSVSTPSGRRMMADFITEQYAYGVHELLNKVPPIEDGASALVDWTERGAAWMERILRTMAERGCTRQELAILEPLWPPRHVEGYSQGNVYEHRLSIYQEQLGRLKELEARFESRS